MAMALCSATVRQWWLKACCAVAEGADVPDIKYALASGTFASASKCVAAILGDVERRVPIINGREGFARSLGSVYAGSVARFLGGSIQRGTKNADHTVFIDDVAASFGSIAITSDGRLLVPLCASVMAVDRAELSQACNVTTLGCGPMGIIVPRSVCIAPDGVAFVADWATSHVQMHTPQLAFVADMYCDVAEYRFPHAMCANEHFVAVINSAASVLLFSRGTCKSMCVIDCSDIIGMPLGMCALKTHGALTVAVADVKSNQVVVACLEGATFRCVRRLGHEELCSPSSIACSDADEMVVSCTFRGNESICIFDALGDLCMTLRCRDDVMPSVCIYAGAIHTCTSLNDDCVMLDVYD
jgi:hypothetical protein